MKTYSRELKEVLKKISSKSEMLSDDEEASIDKAVDTLIIGIKKDVNNEGWIDSDGNFKIG